MRRLLIATLAVSLAAVAGCRDEALSQSSASAPSERTGVIQHKGMPMTLLGPELKVGDMAPDFAVVNADLQPTTLSEYRGRVVVISSVPSIDTPMCKLQTHRFDEEAGRFSPDVVFLTVSVDLPFAQQRWCDDENVHQTALRSDYRDHSFGEAYGLIIKEQELLARAVIIVDREGVIRYLQIVKEQFSEPNYNEVLTALADML
ncbi:MAG: thiol peroxidase [Phycisphaerales bacterium]|nr:thiol peroxidase [Phycisphaerales bacterium]